MINLTINNKNIIVPRGSSILEACKQIGIDIPRFCYHENLSVAGNCRMCLVEIEKSPKPVASCAMPVTPNMVIFTDSPLVKKARENVLEILLLNHPLDCPICDQAGECDLQDQTRQFGGDYSRFYTLKRSVEDKNCGPLIKTIMTRCIHCTRCVRFATEIAGIDTFGTLKRGEETEIGTYIEKLLKTEISGNIIDLCPVGALTSKPYAFTSRPWELRKYSSIDPLDCVGSNITIDLKESEIVRILPRFSNNINQDWISDKIRFSYDSLKRLRIKTAYQKFFNKFEVIELFKIITTVKQILLKKNILIPVQSNLDLQSLEILKKIQILPNIKIRLLDSINFLPIYSTFNDIEKADSFLFLGTNLKIEAPILQIRLRTSFLKNNFLISTFGIPFINTINTNFLSLKLTSFLNFSAGKSILQQIISCYNLPFFFIGRTFYSRFNIIILKEFILTMNKNSKFLVIDNSPNLRALSYFNFPKLTQKDINWSSIILNLNLEENLLLRKLILLSNKHIIWLNTHGTKLAEKANYIIPVASFFETSASYINAEGQKQKTFAILPQLQNVVSVKKLLILFFGNQFNLNKIETVIVTLSKNYSNFKNLKFKLFIFLDSNLITQYPAKSNLEDFYLNTKFTKASAIMGQCSQALRKNTTNFF